MIKIGMYLPIYGGWLPSRKSVKVQADGTYFEKEKDKLPSFDYVKRMSLKAEKIGIDSLWIPDHMLNPIKGEQAPSLEAWTLASAIAESTKSVIITHTCLCEAFRYPAVLAKQATTLNEISNGRFWLSIGAGWFKREYEAYGLPFYCHNSRVDRAREAIKIIRRLWKENSVTFSGKYYSITKGVLEPKPDPKPPIWYAGMSESARNLISEEADGWLMKGRSLKETKENIIDMNKRLKKKGRKKIEFAMPALTFIRDTDKEAKNVVDQITEGYKNIFNKTMVTGLVGSPETVAQKIQRLESIGINHILLQLTPTFRELQNVEKVFKILKKIDSNHS